MSITSYFSFFSLFVTIKAIYHGLASVVYEINEEKEKTVQSHRDIFSVNSCNSFFSYFVTVRPSVRKVSRNPVFHSLFCGCFASCVSGIISNSQPTTCGHTACSLRVGWRVAAAPSNPAKIQRQVTP